MSDYADNWDRYYRHTYQKRQSESLWAVENKVAAAHDYLRLKKYFDPELPCLDIGCGTGEQTAHLHLYFAKTIGVDVSITALELARERYSQPGLSFHELDLSGAKAIREFAQANGPVNVYIRGVLHQIKAEHQRVVQQALLNLINDKGYIYINEVASGIRTYLENIGANFSELPARMRLVLLSNLPPVGLTLDTLDQWFLPNEFTIVDSGEAQLATNLKLADGTPLAIPSVYAVLKKS